VVGVLGHEHLSEQSRGGDALVDDVRRHGCLHDGLAAGAGPLAAHMALHGEHAGLVVQLLRHVFPDALHRAAAGARGGLGLVADLAARQVGRERQPLGLLALRRRRARCEQVEFAGDRFEVGFERVFEQALLLALEGLAGGSELHPLEHGVLVRELVDGGLLVGEVALVALELLVLERHPADQRENELA
jgi:hypothetical protein